MLLIRQPGPFRPEADGFSMDEMDLLDWMAEHDVEPGGDCAGFFHRRMTMVLSAILKLDAAGFTTPLGMALEGMKTGIRIAGDLGGKIKSAFDMGGELSDLASATGESAGEIMVLRQAFEGYGRRRRGSRPDSSHDAPFAGRDQ